MANGFVNRYSYPRVSVSVQTSVRTSNVLSLPRTNRFSYPQIGGTTRILNEISNRNMTENNVNFSVIESINKNVIARIDNVLSSFPESIKREVTKIQVASYNPIQLVSLNDVLEYYI